MSRTYTLAALAAVASAACTDAGQSMTILRNAVPEENCEVPNGENGTSIGAGRIQWQETVHDGIANAPKAFLGLFRGDNSGKMLVRVGPDRA